MWMCLAILCFSPEISGAASCPTDGVAVLHPVTAHALLSAGVFCGNMIQIPALTNRPFCFRHHSKRPEEAPSVTPQQLAGMTRRLNRVWMEGRDAETANKLIDEEISQLLLTSRARLQAEVVVSTFGSAGMAGSDMWQSKGGYCKSSQ